LPGADLSKKLYFFLISISVTRTDRYKGVYLMCHDGPHHSTTLPVKPPCSWRTQ
jgi:hypothetical protein